MRARFIAGLLLTGFVICVDLGMTFSDDFRDVVGMSLGYTNGITLNYWGFITQAVILALLWYLAFCDWRRGRKLPN